MAIRDVSARKVFTLFCCLGYFHMYALFVNLSIAIVAMVKEQPALLLPEVQDAETCTGLEEAASFNSTKSSINHSILDRGEFSWDSTTRGQVLGSYFYGYTLTQILGGVLADKYGGKWVFGTGMFLSSLCTLTTPLMARWRVEALMATRVMMGLSQGVVFPSSFNLISRWAPVAERSRITTSVLIGLSVGNSVSFGISGLICDSDWGWPAVFYIFGTLGCIWFGFWVIFVYDSPETHPRISKKELTYILERRGTDQTKRPAIPWRCILSSGALWALFFTHVTVIWGFFTFVIELPSYLSNILHFNLSDNGFLSALPQLLYITGSIVSSVVADRLRKSGLLHITLIRKIFNSIGSLGASVCLLSVSFSGCRPLLVTALLSASMLMMGCTMPGWHSTYVDMSPEFAGVLFGISNTLASLTGLIIPAYTGWIMKDGESVARWRVIFLTAAVLYALGGLVYGIFCTAERQEWGTRRPPGGATEMTKAENLKQDQDRTHSR